MKKVILLLIFLVGFARSDEVLDLSEMVGPDELQQFLLGLKIPDIPKSGKLSYLIKNIKITSASVGSVKLYNPEGMKFYLEADDINLNVFADADVSYKFRLFWKTRTVSASFSVKGSVKDTYLKQGIDIELTDNGIRAVPTICKCKIGEIKVKLEGKSSLGKFIARLVNTLTKLFKNRLTKLIETEICKGLQPELKKNLGNIDLASMLNIS